MVRDLQMALRFAGPRPPPSPEQRRAAAALAARLDGVRRALDGTTAAIGGTLDACGPLPATERPGPMPVGAPGRRSLTGRAADRRPPPTDSPAPEGRSR